MSKKKNNDYNDLDVTQLIFGFGNGLRSKCTLFLYKLHNIHFVPTFMPLGTKKLLFYRCVDNTLIIGKLKRNR